jgi:DNA polymerase III delta prime subunit
LSKLLVEKYRPATFDDYVFCSSEQQNKFKSYITNQDIPNLLLSGTPGSGKTTAAKVFINSLGIDDSDILEINASDENNVDTIREKIISFITTMSMSKFRIVHLGECLEENEKIQVIEDGKVINKKLNELPTNKDFELLSFSQETGLIENDIGRVTIKREAEVYEVELEDGRKILVTDNHPFILSNLSELTIKDGLKIGDELATI